MAPPPTPVVSCAVLVAPPSGSARDGSHLAEPPTVFGISSRDRLVRGLEAVGVPQIDRSGRAATERALYLRSDYVFDARLLDALLSAPRDQVLCGADGTAAAVVAEPELAESARAALAGGSFDGLQRAAPADLVSSFDHKLRKHTPPLLLRVGAMPVRSIEDQLFAASYKGITDGITRWVWPVPARASTRWCAARGITPNQITVVSWLLTGLVLALWSVGWFGSGLVLAWAMTFLDTVDGKLARVTLTSSRLGHVMDHGLDLIHPPFWWAAWAWGLAAAAGEPGFGSFEPAMLVVVAGYFAGRALEGVFLVLFRMEMFSWRRFDGVFRQVIARRNPNLLLLTTGLLLGSPAVGLNAVAAWTAACIGIQIVRIGQAITTRLAGGTIEPWEQESSTRPTQGGNQP